MENYLEHHGIKGQKWGVRRFQNEDGTLTDIGKKKYKKYLETDVIKKGSKIYRTSSVKEESGNGPMYVTINKSDMKYYTDPSKAAGWIADVQNKKVSELYKNTYVANKDLKIATTTKVHEVVSMLSKKDNKFDKDAAIGNTAMKFINAGFSKDTVERYAKYANLTKSKAESEMKKDAKKNSNGDKETEKALLERYKSNYNIFNKTTSDTLLEIKSSYGPDKLMTTSMGFGSDTGSKSKQKVINELKKQGYEGMSDAAGIGGAGGYSRETKQATILFTTDSLNQIKSKSMKSEVIKSYIKSGAFVTSMTIPGLNVLSIGYAIGKDKLENNFKNVKLAY